jgi:hypothetical protein
MENIIDKVVNLLKQQAEVFLLDAGEFYPFGTCINRENEIIPVAAKLENDRPSSLEVIDLLENAFKKGIEKGDYKLASIAIDITIRENNKAYDAIEIRFFESDKEVYKKYLKYEIKENSVNFFPSPPG